MTRPGIEGGRNATKRRSVTPVPAEDRGEERPGATSGCNECSEALEAADGAVRIARRLAMVAMSAVVNGDVQRARIALEDLLSSTTPHDDRRGRTGTL